MGKGIIRKYRRTLSTGNHFLGTQHQLFPDISLQSERGKEMLASYIEDAVEGR
jgi:hypothetical protein